tara:strand:+ start:96 stop:338 length:243 start_codon:yes stop_codon:yes gene_type:complete
LLVRVVVFLIQHQQAQRAQRKKHSGARANDHHGIAALETATPSANPLTGGATAVVLENSPSETLATTIHELGNQADLRSE